MHKPKDFYSSNLLYHVLELVNNGKDRVSIIKEITGEKYLKQLENGVNIARFLVWKMPLSLIRQNFFCSQEFIDQVNSIFIDESRFRMIFERYSSILSLSSMDYLIHVIDDLKDRAEFKYLFSCIFNDQDIAKMEEAIYAAFCHNREDGQKEISANTRRTLETILKGIETSSPLYECNINSDDQNKCVDVGLSIEQSQCQSLNNEKLEELEEMKTVQTDELIEEDTLPQLLEELQILRKRFELSKTVGPGYFEPGMMEFLDQSFGDYDENNGKMIIRFEARGTRYENRTELIENVHSGDPVQIQRDSENPHNSNNFRICDSDGMDLGNLPASLCNALAPLFDSGKVSIDSSFISFVEPISKRSRHARQAILFVQMDLTVFLKQMATVDPEEITVQETTVSTSFESMKLETELEYVPQNESEEPDEMVNSDDSTLDPVFTMIPDEQDELYISNTKPISCSGEGDYIFISYSHRDSERVYEIILKLQNEGYNVWFDEGIEIGSEWADNIAVHVNDCSCLFAFVSENYLQSMNCIDELEYARDEGKKIIMIYLEDVVLPPKIKMRYNRYQSINYHKEETQRFYEKLLSSPILK